MLTDFKVLIMMEAASSLEASLSAYEYVTDDSVYDRTNGIGGFERSQFILEVLKGYRIDRAVNHDDLLDAVYRIGGALADAMYSSLIHNKTLPGITDTRREVLDVAFNLVHEVAQ